MNKHIKGLLRLVVGYAVAFIAGLIAYWLTGNPYVAMFISIFFGRAMLYYKF